MKIVLGADSAGKPLLDVIAAHLKSRPDLEITDLSRDGFYADTADTVASSILAGDNQRGILICGTGIGMAITANKVPGVRAAQAHDVYSAERARKSNNAQILTLGARVIGPESAKTVVHAWLASEFAGGASTRKVDKIDELERRLATTGS
jgi:D-erythrulose 4-phosphate isomerase